MLSFRLAGRLLDSPEGISTGLIRIYSAITYVFLLLLFFSSSETVMRIERLSEPQSPALPVLVVCCLDILYMTLTNRA